MMKIVFSGGSKSLCEIKASRKGGKPEPYSPSIGSAWKMFAYFSGSDFSCVT